MGPWDHRVQVREVRDRRRNAGRWQGRCSEAGGLETRGFHQHTGYVHFVGHPDKYHELGG